MISTIPEESTAAIPVIWPSNVVSSYFRVRLDTANTNLFASKQDYIGDPKTLYFSERTIQGLSIEP